MSEFQRYVDNVCAIWERDKPQLTQEGAQESYYRHFSAQYEQIRALAGDNKRMVRERLTPYFKGVTPVQEQDAAFLEEVCHALEVRQDLEAIDRILSLKCRRLLIDYYRKNGQTASLIQGLYSAARLCYYSAFALNRLSAPMPDELFFRYNDEGLAYTEELASYLEPERFAQLDKQSKWHVLASGGYAFLFQKGESYGAENLQHKIESALRPLKLVEDPFYARELPEFSWRDYELHSLYYVAMCADYISWEGSDPERMAIIRRACDRLEQEPELYERVDQKALRRSAQLVRMFQGEITSQEYIAFLLREYAARAVSGYSYDDVADNLLIPGKVQDEMVRQKGRGTGAETALLAPLYREIIDYTEKAPHTLSQEFLLNYLQGLMADFQDVPGGPTFGEMAHVIMANCSVSTTIHSRMVGQLAAILVRALVRLRPEALVGVCRCETAEQVQKQEEEIVEFVMQCGRYHDLGKLCYLDIVGIIYRDFFDEEFDAIKRHPAIGGEMLLRHPDTAPYAMVALGHHRWYNEKAGYPAQYHRAEDPHPIVTDLIAIADCLDAATDTIFRSYNPGITLEKFISEVQEGAGSRYNPVGAYLLEQESVQAQLREMLSAGREQAYQTIWHHALRTNAD